jgi:hypothetical protein
VKLTKVGESGYLTDGAARHSAASFAMAGTLHA